MEQKKTICMFQLNQFFKQNSKFFFFFIAALSLAFTTSAQKKAPRFRVIAFFTGKHDLAHISFDHEANKWFPKMAKKYHFEYDSTTDWDNMNPQFLSHYQVVIFLDSRPEDSLQRAAFQQYMAHGGSWMGFHFAAFALTPSAYPQNWNWYHNVFLGSGSYVSNTWRPTSAILRVEDRHHPATRHLPKTFKSAPNEWYRWSNDLRKDPAIKILISIDSKSFPLGTGPKPSEIWHSGYYPVVWTNIHYRMIYMNMGHNDMDYEDKSNRQLSYTFANKIQDRLVIDALLWLGSGKN
jgi:uncharacterized protein